MLAKEVLQNIQSECACEVVELPNQAKGTTVTSYTLTSECASCKAKREEQNIVAGKQRRRQEILSQLNQLDLKAIRPLIDADVVRIQEIKDKKDVLRIELNVIG